MPQNLSASNSDFDVYDASNAARATARGFQRELRDTEDAHIWQEVRGCILRGKLDAVAERESAATAIGAIRWQESDWYYRFRFGLRDGHGRSGRIVFVVVRTATTSAPDARTAALLAAAVRLEGLPLDLAPIESAAEGNRDTATTRIEDFLRAQAPLLGRMREGDHHGWLLAEGSSATRHVPLPALTAQHQRESPPPVDRVTHAPTAPTAAPEPRRTVASKQSPFISAIASGALGFALGMYLGHDRTPTTVVELKDGSKWRVRQVEQLEGPHSDPPNRVSREASARPQAADAAEEHKQLKKQEER